MYIIFQGKDFYKGCDTDISKSKYRCINGNEQLGWAGPSSCQLVFAGAMISAASHAVQFKETSQRFIHLPHLIELQFVRSIENVACEYNSMYAYINI